MTATVIYVTCLAGHRIATRSRSGKVFRCPQCWQQRHCETLIVVPPRPPKAVMSGMQAGGGLQNCLPAIRIACDYGHVTSTQKRPGGKIRCSRCQRGGREVLIVVPEPREPDRSPGGEEMA